MIMKKPSLEKKAYQLVALIFDRISTNSINKPKGYASEKYLTGLALMLLFCGLAQAQCQLSLSRAEINDGRVRDGDYSGQHKRWKTLNDRHVQMTAICDSPVKMAIFAQGGTQDANFQ